MSNLSTFFPSGGSSPLGGTFEATASGAISDGDPLFLNTDGTVSNAPQNLGMGTKLFISTPDSTLFPSSPNAGAILEYSLSDAFNVYSMKRNDAFYVENIEANLHSLAFSTDGKNMYYIGTGSDRIYQASLSVAFDISSAIYERKQFVVSSQDTNPYALAINNDGTKIFMSGGNARVYEYALSTAYDVTTASLTTNFLVSQAAAVADICFSSDGTKMYAVDYTVDTIFQYTIRTNYTPSQGRLRLLVLNLRILEQIYSSYGMICAIQNWIPSVPICLTAWTCIFHLNYGTSQSEMVLTKV